MNLFFIGLRTSRQAAFFVAFRSVFAFPAPSQLFVARGRLRQPWARIYRHFPDAARVKNRYCALFFRMGCFPRVFEPSTSGKSPLDRSAMGRPACRSRLLARARSHFSPQFRSPATGGTSRAAMGGCVRRWAIPVQLGSVGVEAAWTVGPRSKNTELSFCVRPFGDLPLRGPRRCPALPGPPPRVASARLTFPAGARRGPRYGHYSRLSIFSQRWSSK